jgi:mRNA interferase RelE/StbE
VSYSVFILRRAQKELAGLPTDAYSRVKSAILSLENEPRPKTSKKLVGRDGWRIRVDEYRVIYEIDDAARIITVLNIGHRRDVYR